MTAPQGEGGGRAARWSSLEELEHELRTPLTSIRSISEILRDYPDLSPAQRQRFLEAMLEEERRLARAVDRVLRSPDLARLLG